MSDVNRYEANKYCGGVYCGNGEFGSIQECFDFADDGFCDYVRVTDMQSGRTIKIHFDGQDLGYSR